MVSLRGGALHLLSLRRLLAVDGKPVSAVPLRVGLEVGLAEGLFLRVLELHLPTEIPALRLSDGSRHLLGSLASVHAGPPPRVASRFEPDAAWVVWSTDEAWRVARPGEPGRLWVPGDRVALHTGDGGQPGWMALEWVPLHAAGQPPTSLERGVRAPLTIVAQHDTVQIHRPGRPPTLLGGRGARLISELVQFDGPVAWEVLAREVWTDPVELDVLRHRLDVNLTRLRRRLRSEGIRADLVNSDGSGQVALLLYDGDVAEERG